MNDLINNLIHTNFPGGQSEFVAGNISRCSSFDIYPNQKQIWASILILSKSNMGEFEIVLEHAKKDWRDVVIVAGFAIADWEVIARKYCQQP